MSDRWVLVSDVDGTLLGHDEATARFAEYYAANRDWLTVVYNSGRFYVSLMESVASTPLPTPDCIIGGVGTEIRKPPEGCTVGQWERHIAESWDHTLVRELLDGIPGLELQPEEFQSPFKVSYYYPDASRDALDALEARIRARGIVPRIIYSSRIDLDVLPARADKGKAAAYLAQEWEVPFERVIVSGDSGNDTALFQQGFRGIVVGNAQDELKRERHPDTYQAQASFADGVLEGLQYWTAGEGSNKSCT